MKWGLTWQERFWPRVQKSDGCWLWTGGATTDGYGVLKIDGIAKRAPRLSWEIHAGSPVPSGMRVCHKCDTPRCVRPDHLFIGTDLDNSRDAKAKGRRRPGNVKLYSHAVAVIRIRRNAGETGPALARAYGVTKGTIYYVCNPLYRAPERQITPAKEEK